MILTYIVFYSVPACGTYYLNIASTATSRYTLNGRGNHKFVIYIGTAFWMVSCDDMM